MSTIALIDKIRMLTMRVKTVVPQVHKVDNMSLMDMEEIYKQLASLKAATENAIYELDKYGDKIIKEMEE